MQDTLNVLLLKDDAWTAQCLEHDIAAQGETIGKAILELTRTLAGELTIRVANGEAGLERVPPAPRFYWKMFHEAGEPMDASHRPRFTSGQDLPPPFMLPKFDELRVA